MVKKPRSRARVANRSMNVTRSCRSSSGVFSHPSGSYITARTSTGMRPAMRSSSNAAQLAQACPCTAPGHPPMMIPVGWAKVASAAAGSRRAIAATVPRLVSQCCPSAPLIPPMTRRTRSRRRHPSPTQLDGHVDDHVLLAADDLAAAELDQDVLHVDPVPLAGPLRVEQ